jgi:outer membrane protein assembly factor BamB
LIALNRESLQPVWETSVGDSPGTVSSPAVARGHVYVGTPNNGLLCVGAPQTENRRPLWPGEPGAFDGSALPDRGALLWRYPKQDSEDTTPPPGLVGPVAVIGERLLVPVADGARKGLACLLVDSKQRETPSESWFVSASNGVSLAPAANDEVVLFVDGREGDTDRRLRCVELASGRERWSEPVSADASGRFVMDHEVVCIEDERGRVGQRGLDGKRRWQANTGHVAGMVASGPLLVIGRNEPPGLVVLDKPTGQLLAAYELGSRVVAAPVVEGRIVLVATAGGVSGIDIVNGTSLWNVEGGASAPVAVGNEWLAYVNVAGELVLANKLTGAVRTRLPDAVPGMVPVLTRDAVLFVSKEGLTIHNLAESRSQRWMATAWLGAQTSPLVLWDSAVYFATDKRGLVKAGKYR